MEKEFVPYEQALALKELGFNEPCFGYYLDEKLNIFHSTSENDRINSKTIEIFSSDVITSPLYQQVFRWFIKKYDLHPSFTRYKSSSINREPTIFTHLYEIQIIDENADKIFHVGDFNSLEEAELECLKKLIEIVKEG